MDGRYGVVFNPSVEEVMTPSYIQCREYDETLVLIGDGELLCFDRMMGNELIFECPEHDVLIDYAAEELFHVYYDNESRLIDHKGTVRYRFPQRLDYFTTRHQYLLGNFSDSFAVIYTQNFDSVHTKIVAAQNVTVAQFFNNETSDMISYLVLYGGAYTYTFSHTADAVIPIYKKTTSEDTAKKLVAQQLDVGKDGFKLVEFLPPVVRLGPSAQPNYMPPDPNPLEKTIKVNNPYELKSSPYDSIYFNVSVYQNDQVMMMFKYDIQNKKALLPQEHQDRIGLKIED